jgi:predicted enzyme related to lactoylglutathione lyase
MILLYVDSPAASAHFYQGLLGHPPVESSPNFAMFALQPGLMLGLWARREVKPAPGAAGGGAELIITVADADAVRANHAEWNRRGVPIVQEPTVMDFGMTFVAVDPDGHRVRVLAAGAP